MTQTTTSGGVCAATGGQMCLCRLALAVGLTWGLGCFLVGVATIYAETYGRRFVGVMGSIYPGYAAGTWSGAGLGLLWGAMDGFFAVLVVAIIYRLLSVGGHCCCAGQKKAAA